MINFQCNNNSISEHNQYMGQITYKDLLDYLNLSNWQFILLLLFLLFIYATVATFWKVGAIDKIKVTKKMVPQFKSIYISYQGSYDKIGVIYSQSVEDFEMVFKFSNYFTIYYSLDKQDDDSRAVIGVAINKIEQSKIPLFLSKFPLYKTCTFPSSVSLSASYPLVNSASSMIVVAQVYPIIQQKIKQLSISRKKEQIMEIYHFEAASPYLDVIFPIDNQECFDLWYEPTDYSRVFNQKKE